MRGREIEFASRATGSAIRTPHRRHLTVGYRDEPIPRFIGRAQRTVEEETVNSVKGPSVFLDFLDSEISSTKPPNRPQLVIERHVIRSLRPRLYFYESTSDQSQFLNSNWISQSLGFSLVSCLLLTLNNNSRNCRDYISSICS